jgi:hypothetical protein
VATVAAADDGDDAPAASAEADASPPAWGECGLRVLLIMRLAALCGRTHRMLCRRASVVALHIAPRCPASAVHAARREHARVDGWVVRDLALRIKL